MQKFELVIIQPDGKTYWTEGFDSKKELNAWLKEEQARPYWKKDFSTEIRDNTKAIKAEEDARKAFEKTESDRQKTVRDELKALRKKQNLTLAEVKAGFDRILDLLGVVPDPESPTTPAPAAKS